ncbi:MAG: hypothetical protein LIO54_05090 [Oscillospiraceae bacterium]|nr:hypothetical protein [Oscillospiraceae bacterium]
MWLSERIAPSQRGGAHAETGDVTIGGAKPAVLLDGERRGVRVVSPQGICWKPAVGTQALLLETDDGEKYILGLPDGGIDAAALPDGALCLRRGAAWLCLETDGTISAGGELHIAGDVYLTGRLFLNGVELTAETEEE